MTITSGRHLTQKPENFQLQPNAAARAQIKLKPENSTRLCNLAKAFPDKQSVFGRGIVVLGRLDVCAASDLGIFRASVSR